MRLKHREGSYRWFFVRSEPLPTHCGYRIGCAVDINAHIEGEAIDREQLRKAAFEDVLTRLPNRRFFEQELKRCLDGEKQSMVGLIVFDIDDFKQINEHHSHSAGDEVIKLIGKVLSEGSEPSEFIARIGGDEFALIIPDITTTASLEVRSVHLVSLLDAALRRNSRARHCQVSVGAAMSQYGDTACCLFKKAELALHWTKDNKRGSVGLFSVKMRESAERKLEESELARKALREGWIVPYYQPTVALSDSSVVGFEALLRINHPDLGVLSPLAIADALGPIDIQDLILA